MSGALTTTWTIAIFAGLALRPPMPRRSTPFNVQFMLGWWINEIPFWGLWWLLAGTLGALIRPQPTFEWSLIVAFAAIDIAMLARIAERSRSARPALSAAFRAGYGNAAEPRYTRPEWWRIVLLPIISWRPDVRRIRNRRYGPARRGHRLDVYVSRRPARREERRGSGAPVLIYLHGGGFFMGSKMLGGHPLIYRLAARGWVCISADYRLVRARYGDQLADARAVLAWARENAARYGGDPDTVFLSGGSAGAHLAATTALTDPASDTRTDHLAGAGPASTRHAGVAGVVGLYGYYGGVGGSGVEPASPGECIHPGAPPFLIVHGARDTLVVPASARAFADRLRAVSRRPVVHAELPGTQHNFDFFQSPRCHAVTDAVIRFASLVADRDVARSDGFADGPRRR